MSYYIPFFALLYFFILQNSINDHRVNSYKNNGAVYILLSFISFFILNVLRLQGQSLFGDIQNYYLIFEYMQPISSAGMNDELFEYPITKVDKGFLILITIFKSLSINFEIFLFLLFTIQIFLYRKFLIQFKIDEVNGFPIYVALIMMTFQIGMLRQAIAFCFFLLAIMHLNKKTLFTFLLLIGSSFHSSVLIGFLAIFCTKKRSPYFYLVSFIICLIIYLSEFDIIGLILRNIRFVNELSRLFYYQDVGLENNYMGVGFWERVITFLCMILIYSKNTHYSKLKIIIFNLGIISLFMQFIFFSSPTITSRLRLYFVIFPYLFISQYIYSEIRSKFKWIFQVFFNSYLFLYLEFQINYMKQ